MHSSNENEFEIHDTSLFLELLPSFTLKYLCPYQGQPPSKASRTVRSYDVGNHKFSVRTKAQFVPCLNFPPGYHYHARNLKPDHAVPVAQWSQRVAGNPGVAGSKHSRGMVWYSHIPL
uniref:Uncharacterized protein n=1 Tax=Cacopsylla melanoneura TaxID=428564 RepID=A0A8D8ZKT1_9HEMI